MSRHVRRGGNLSGDRTSGRATEIFNFLRDEVEQGTGSFVLEQLYKNKASGEPWHKRVGERERDRVIVHLCRGTKCR